MKILAVLGTALFVLFGVYLFETSPLGKPALVATIVPQTVLELTNADRAANGVAPLTESPLLDQAAQAKAEDMLARGYYAHLTPEGNSPLYFLDQVGYKYQNAGENLGLNYADSQELETGWMNSPEHRQNVLRAVFTEAGVGTAKGEYQGRISTFAVELFATPLPPSTHAAALPSSKSKSLPLVTAVPRTAPDANTRYTASLEALITSLIQKVAELRAQLSLVSQK